jgi:hypothetical protein
MSFGDRQCHDYFTINQLIADGTFLKYQPHIAFDNFMYPIKSGLNNSNGHVVNTKVLPSNPVETEIFSVFHNMFNIRTPEFPTEWICKFL